jgi:hypothetical protein
MVTKGLEPYGKDEAHTDDMIKKVITDVYPRIVTGAGGG